MHCQALTYTTVEYGYVVYLMSIILFEKSYPTGAISTYLSLLVQFVQHLFHIGKITGKKLNEDGTPKRDQLSG